MRKKFLVIFLVANLCVALAMALVVGGLLYLAETYPFQAGSRFYGVQRAAETWRLSLARDSEKRAEFALSLAERRIADLAQAKEPDAVTLAASDLSLALDEAVRSVALAPAATREAASARLERVLSQAEGVVSAVDADAEYASVEVLDNKLSELLAADDLDEQLAQVPEKPVNTLLESVAIPFLGQTVDHSFYPLDGGHTDIACAECHEDGTYAGTLAGCADCHQAGPMGVVAASLTGEDALFSSPIYPTHFAGGCTDCHTTASWEPEAFDHTGVVECLTCHTEDLPSKDHYVASVGIGTRLASLTEFGLQSSPEVLYPERCVNCHPDTEDWLVVDFDHEGFEDCVTCHHDSAPVDHYTDDCASCHQNPEDWNDVSFDHDGYTNCADCHSVSLPHYPGACASCHTTGSWTSVAFNHDTSTSCVACHTAPSGHYSGDCATCHGTDTWLDVTMDHTGLTDCVACHSQANHYAGQCSSCHISTVDWAQILFNHSGYSDCAGCHTKDKPSGHPDGQCSTCHNTNNWYDAVNHDGLTDCASCHLSDMPSGHYGEACADCHTTGSWSNVSMPDCGQCHEAPAGHTYAVACAECHTAGHPNPSWSTDYSHEEFVNCSSCHVAPDDHWPGECSLCHSTSWEEASFSHSGILVCSSCHEAPSGHWPGECSDCHVSTSDWLDIVFDHTTYTNCKACHPHPTGHPRGQCSNCHTTDSWKPIHNEDLLDCQSCHLEDVGDPLCIGQCSSCHTSTDTWTEWTFSHVELLDCQSCHADDMPADHYDGECSNCHPSTADWLVIDFDHTDYTDCATCHDAPADGDHTLGILECAICHSTETWTFQHSTVTSGCAYCHEAPPNHYVGACEGCHNISSWLDATAPAAPDAANMPTRDESAPLPELPSRDEPTPTPVPTPVMPER